VDLRHEATHRGLPSLPMLRLGAKESLFLLFERFWRPQQEVLERRGRGLASHRGRLSGRPAPVLDRRLIDKRLKLVIGHAASAKKRQRSDPHVKDKVKKGKNGQQPATNGEGEPDPVDAAVREDDAGRDAGLAATSVVELASLAVDETRLLTRLFAAVFAGQPHTDGREALALNLLCAASSDNFALRLMRQLVLGALGWAGADVAGASDARPSLRNVCDDGEQGAAGVGVPHAFGGATALGAPLLDAEADRLLRWLEVLVADREQPSGKVAAGEASYGESRIRLAVQSLAPWLRNRVVEQVVASEGAGASANTPLLQRAAKVWQLLKRQGLDGGAARFLQTCQAGLKPAVAAAAQGASPASPQAAATATAPSAAPAASLEELEALLEARKRRRGTAGATVAKLEPWTAVGTIFDPSTLQVHSTLEPDHSPALPEGAKEAWLAWAAGAPAVAVSGRRGSGTGAVEPSAEAVETPGVRRGKPAASPVVTTGAADAQVEADVRRQAATLLETLQPLDL